MIDYLLEIKPLQDQGISNEVIALHLSARTQIPMSTEQTRTILQETGTVLTDPVMVNQRSGTLIDFYRTLSAGDNQTLIAWFISEVFGNVATEISTNEYPRSMQFQEVEASLPIELQTVSAQLVEMSGGRPNAGTTEADVVAIQTQWEADEAAWQAAEEAARQAEEERQQNIAIADGHFQQAQTLWNQNIAPLYDLAEPVTDPAVWQAALQSMADNWSN